VAELSAQGKLTREGKRWQGHTVLEKVRNPLYCGRGQLRQWKVEWERRTDDHTGETYEVRKLVKRDPNEAGAYLPLAKDAVPVLIPPELFDRVQRKLDERKYFVGRIGRERSPHHPDDTLLHGGLVCCAHCGGVMVRYWRNEKVKSRPGPIPYYRCIKRANDPAHPCRVHAIPAPDVDLLAIELLAFALTDPEQVVKLAELADEQFIRAAEDADRAGVRYDGYRERLDEIERDKTKYLRRLADYHPEKDAEEIEITRGKLAHLEDEQVRMEREAAAAMPHRERATLRQQMLDTLRRGGLVLGLKQTADGKWYSTQHDVSAWLAFEALEMPSLGQFYNEARAKAGLDMLPTEEAELEARKLATERGFGAMPLDELAARLLASMPREHLRKMLRDFNAVVWVSRPHGTRHNPTTVEQRVVLELMRADGQPGLRLCADGTNG